MTRKTFFTSILGFLGIAQAQEVNFGYPIQWMNGNHKALNNQCPVCGRIAGAYLRPLRDENYGALRNCKPVGEYMVACDAAHLVPDGPTYRVIRCERCNAAFYQDSEN